MEFGVRSYRLKGEIGCGSRGSPNGCKMLTYRIGRGLSLVIKDPSLLGAGAMSVRFGTRTVILTLRQHQRLAVWSRAVMAHQVWEIPSMGGRASGKAVSLPRSCQIYEGTLIRAVYRVCAVASGHKLLEPLTCRKLIRVVCVS